MMRLITASLDAAGVALIAPAVKSGIGVDDLVPETALGQAEAVGAPQHGRQV